MHFPSTGRSVFPSNVYAQGQVLTRPAQVRTGAPVHARLAEGELDLIVAQPRLL